MKTIFHVYQRTEYVYNDSAQSFSDALLLNKTLHYYRMIDLEILHYKFVDDSNIFEIVYHIDRNEKDFYIRSMNLQKYNDYLEYVITTRYSALYNYITLIRIVYLK